MKKKPSRRIDIYPLPSDRFQIPLVAATYLSENMADALAEYWKLELEPNLYRDVRRHGNVMQCYSPEGDLVTFAARDAIV